MKYYNTSLSFQKVEVVSKTDDATDYHEGDV